MKATPPHMSGHEVPVDGTDNPAAGVAYALLHRDGRLSHASPVLAEMTAPWVSVEQWWHAVSGYITSPAPTQCPVCSLGQCLGVVSVHVVEPQPRQTSSETGRLETTGRPDATESGVKRTLRLFEISYAGHPHALGNDGADDMLLIRDVTQERQHNDAVSHTIRQYESICTFIQDVYYRIDMQGNLLFISPSCDRLLSYTSEELLGTRLVDLVAIPEAFQELMEILQTTPAVHDFSFAMHCKNGRQIPVSITAKVILDDAGERLAMEGIFRDVSERERLDILLEERTLSYRQALQHLEHLNVAVDRHVLISTVDPNGDILSVNDTFLAVCRYEREEVLGKNHHFLNSGHHPKSFFKEMWRTILGGGVWRGEIRNRKKNGDLFWVDCSIIPFLTPLGKPFQYICVATDISHLVRTRTRMERNRDFLHRVVNAMGDGVIIMDMQGRMLALNQEGERLLGWQEAELMHKNVHEAIHAQRPDGRPVALEECMVHQSLLGRPFRVEEDYYVRKDGTFLPVSHVTSPLRDGKEIIGSIAIFRDNARFRKRYRDLEAVRDTALESARLKSEFLANMSHEIRTPMNAILGMNDLLMDTRLNEEQREFTEIIRDSARSLLALINDILDFSKIEAGKVDIEEIDFSPVTVVEGCAELLATQAHEKALSLVTFVSPHLPHVLRGDPGRLRQMLLNLISNALKFTEEGEVVVRVQPEVRTSQVSLSGQQIMIRFSVTDTGIGLSEQAKEQLFTPFTQADRATSRTYGGTGLGLAISKRLTELMGGTIGVETSVHPDFGEGTSFWFCLPFRYAPVQDADAATLVSEDPIPTDLLMGKEVLIVLESVTEQEMLESCFQAWGMACREHDATQPKSDLLLQALQADDPVDLAVVGLSPEDMNHPAWVSLAQASPDRTTRWVALLNKEDKRLRAFAQNVGFDACLVKPVRQVAWVQCLIRLLVPDEAHRVMASSDTQGLEADDAGQGMVLETERSDTEPPGAEPNAYDALESGKLLLLVEDNPVNQKVTLLQLKKLGYAAHAVNNGQEALEAVTHLPYALILMDCQMPVMDGFEATHAIRKLHGTGTGRSAWQHIPIVAMTANAMKGDRERCLQAGMDDYLSKPVAPELLLKKLQHWIPQGAHKLPPIEIQQLRQLFGNDDSMIRELLNHFPTSARELLDRLWQGVREADQRRIKDTTFELQEACANMGASGMALAARHLEASADEEAWAAANTAMEHLEDAFQQVQQYVQDY